MIKTDRISKDQLREYLEDFVRSSIAISKMIGRVISRDIITKDLLAIFEINSDNIDMVYEIVDDGMKGVFN